MGRVLKYTVLLILLIGFNLSGRAQDLDYPSAAIPEELKENANAVIRLHKQEFVQTDVNNAVYKVHKVVTVLNKKGELYAHFHQTGDKFHELTNFSGIVRNASGKVIKKIKKSDLVISSISEDAFATTGHTIYYECQSSVYPFTVEYIYEEKWKNGILSYPAFIPIKAYSISLEKAESRIEIPQNIQLRYHENYSSGIKDGINGNKRVYSLSFEDEKAIVYEPLAPSLWELLPIVLMAPDQFCYDSYCGNMKDWQNYGAWIAELLKDRDKLPEPFVAQLHEMTRNAPSKRDKVKILFEYLQNNTRYVSIQLGIGGYQPMDAATVVKNRLGDCKALTNLLKAMLGAVGIPSNYCVISTAYESLYPDFPGFNQANHVILLVPEKNDSIWLECTSQTLPFGYVHNSIAGHDAVVISDDGGKLCKLPSFSNEQNLKNTVFEIAIDNEATVKGSFSFREYLNGYENTYQDFLSNDRERINRYINNSVKIPSLAVDNIKITNEEAEIPNITLTGNFHTNDFVNKTGSRLFIPVSPLKKANYKIFTSQTRVHDIHIPNGFREVDTIIYNIPDGYSIESLPKNISLENAFGKLNVNIEQEGKTVTYTQDVTIIKGKYDKSDYDTIKKFFDQIESLSKKNIVLKKI